MVASHDSNVTRVVIVGSGPAGLLASIMLLRRNETRDAKKKYHVTLIDPGVNYGRLDKEDLKRYRSWMIGLSSHGLTSIQKVPDLFEKYIVDIGVRAVGLTFGIGNFIKFNSDIPQDEQDNYSNGFIVDRNYICAGLARYLNEMYLEQDQCFANDDPTHDTSSPMFVAHYGTRALFVDPDEHVVHVRQPTMKSNESTGTFLPTAGQMITAIPYDLLLGCDGIRSVVRNAFVNAHRDFEMDLSQSFRKFKSFHIPLPPPSSSSSVAVKDDGRIYMVPYAMPNITAFILPEHGGGQLNVGIGYSLNKPCDDILRNGTADPNEISAYFAKHFKIMELDWDHVGREFVRQEWSRHGMGHCNFYHSLKLNALLIGDAAHPSEPTLGQGMNTALADAAALDRLLTEYDDDLEQVLPAFSQERVKEGHALTELSSHSFCLSPLVTMEMVFRRSLHSIFHRLLPWLVPPQPMDKIQQGMLLSEAYDQVSKMGYLQRPRQANHKVARDYFEKEIGMVTTTVSSSSSKTTGCAVLVLLTSLVARWYWN